MVGMLLLFAGLVAHSAAGLAGALAAGLALAAAATLDVLQATLGDGLYMFHVTIPLTMISMALYPKSNAESSR